MRVRPQTPDKSEKNPDNYSENPEMTRNGDDWRPPMTRTRTSQSKVEELQER